MNKKKYLLSILFYIVFCLFYFILFFVFFLFDLFSGMSLGCFEQLGNFRLELGVVFARGQRVSFIKTRLEAGLVVILDVDICAGKDHCIENETPLVVRDARVLAVEGALINLRIRPQKCADHERQLYHWR